MKSFHKEWRVRTQKLEETVDQVLGKEGPLVINQFSSGFEDYGTFIGALEMIHTHMQVFGEPFYEEVLVQFELFKQGLEDLMGLNDDLMEEEIFVGEKQWKAVKNWRGIINKCEQGFINLLQNRVSDDDPRVEKLKGDLDEAGFSGFVRPLQQIASDIAVLQQLRDVFENEIAPLLPSEKKKGRGR